MVDLQLDLSITCDDGIPVEMCVTDNITAREIIQLVIASRRAMCPALTISIDDCALSIDAGGIARILCLDSRVDLSSYAIRDLDNKTGQPPIINVFGFREKAAEALKSQNRDDYLIRRAALELRYLIQSSTGYRKSANESSCVTLSNNSYDNREFSVINAERVLSQILSRESLFSTRATSSTNTDHSTCASVNDSKGKVDTKSNSLETHGNNEKGASNIGHQPSLEESVHEQYIDFTYNVKGVLHDSGLHDSGPGRELVNKADIFLYIGDVYGLVNALSNYEQGNQPNQPPESVQRAGSPKHHTTQDRSIGSASIDSDRGRKRRFVEAANHFAAINSHQLEPESVPFSVGYRPCQYDDFSTQSSTGEFFSATADDNVTSPPISVLQNNKELPQLSYHTVAADEQRKYRCNNSGSSSCSSSSSSSRDRGEHLSSRQRGAIASGDDTDDDHMKPQVHDESLGPSLQSQSQSQPVHSTVEVEVEVEHDEQRFDTRRSVTATNTTSASSSASDLLLDAAANEVTRVNADNININVPHCAESVPVTSIDRNLSSATAAPSNNASLISHKESSPAATASDSPAAALHPTVTLSQPLQMTAAAVTTAAVTTAVAGTMKAAAVSIPSRDSTHGLESSVAPHNASKKSSRVTSSSERIGSEPIVTAGGSDVTMALHDQGKNDNKCGFDGDRRMIKHAVDTEANHIISADGHVTVVAVGKAKQEHQGSDMTQAEKDSTSDTGCAERTVTGKQFVGTVHVETDIDDDYGQDVLEEFMVDVLEGMKVDVLEGMKVNVKVGGDIRKAEAEEGTNAMDFTVNAGSNIRMSEEDQEEAAGADEDADLCVSASFKKEEELSTCSDEYRAGVVSMLDATAVAAAAVVVVATTTMVVEHNESETGLKVMSGHDEVEMEEVHIQSAGSEAISPKGPGLVDTTLGDRRETGACMVEVQSERDEMTEQDVRVGEETEVGGDAMREDDLMAKKMEVSSSEEMLELAAEHAGIDARTRSPTGSSAHGLEESRMKEALIRDKVTSSTLIRQDELRSIAEEDEVEDRFDLGAAGSDEGRKKENSRADDEVSNSAARGAKDGSEDNLIEEEKMTHDKEDQNILEEDQNVPEEEGEEDSDQDDISFLPFQIDRTLLLTQSRPLERGESQETFYEKSSCDVLYGNQNSILDPTPSSTNRYDVSGYDDDDVDDDVDDDDETNGSDFRTADDDEAQESTDHPSKNLISSAVPSLATTGDSSEVILYGQPVPSSPPPSSSPMEEQKGGKTAARAEGDDEQTTMLNEVEIGGTRVQVAGEVSESDLAVEEVTVACSLGVRAEGQQSSGGEGQGDSDSALAEVPSEDTTVSPVKPTRDLAHRKGAKASDHHKVNVKAGVVHARTRAVTRSSQETEQDPLRSQMAEQLAEQMRYLEARRAALELVEADCSMDAVSSTDPSSSSDEESDSSVVVMEGTGVSGTACDHFEQLGSQATANASSGCTAENENGNSDDSLTGAGEKVRGEAPADAPHTQDDSPISDEQPRRKRGRPPKRTKAHWRNRFEATQEAHTQGRTPLNKKMTLTDQSQSSSECDGESDGAGSGVHHESQRRLHDHVVEVRAGVSARGRVNNLANLDVSLGRPTTSERFGEDQSNSSEPDMSPVIHATASQSSMRSNTRDPGSHIPHVPTADGMIGSPILHRMSTRTAVRTEPSAPAPAVVLRGASSPGKTSHEISKRRDEKKVKDSIGTEQASSIEGVSHSNEDGDRDGAGAVCEDMTASVEEGNSHDNVIDGSSAGDDGDGDYMDDEVEFQAGQHDIVQV